MMMYEEQMFGFKTSQDMMFWHNKVEQESV